MTALFQLDGADCLTWLRGIESESVDLVITDPAYESLEKHRAIGTTTRLTAAWFPIFRNLHYPALCAELFRVLKPERHLYMFGDYETTVTVADPALREAGFHVWKAIVWDKGDRGMGYHYPASYELIAFAEKKGPKNRQLTTNKYRDVISCPRVRNGYPTEKPVNLAEILIGESTTHGELVIDPFMGSGAFGVAACSLHRRFAGTDVQALLQISVRDRIINDVPGAEPGQMLRPRSQAELWGML